MVSEILAHGPFAVCTLIGLFSRLVLLGCFAALFPRLGDWSLDRPEPFGFALFMFGNLAMMAMLGASAAAVVRLLSLVLP